MPRIEVHEKYFATLVYLVEGKNEHVWLAPKLQKVAAGMLTSYGGKLEKGEDLVSCALRELFAESRVVLWRHDLKKVGIVNFYNKSSDGRTTLFVVHVYISRNFRDYPIKSEEMGQARRFSINAIPFEKMMPGDRCFLPPILAGKKIVGQVVYEQNQILAEPVKIREVKSSWLGL